MNKLYGNKYFGKKGITSKRTAKKRTNTINLRGLNKYKEKEINLKDYKILGDGEITKAITITAKAFTKSAKQKIEKVGGKIIVPVVKVKEAPKSKTDNSQKQKAAQEDNKKEVEKKEKSEK
jgi:ribosomal protein L18E